MDALQASALAAAILTSQGAIWRPVTIQTMHDQEPVIYRTAAGSVTNEYKKQPAKNAGCYTNENGLTLFSLTCGAGIAAGL